MTQLGQCVRLDCRPAHCPCRERSHTVGGRQSLLMMRRPGSTAAKSATCKQRRRGPVWRTRMTVPKGVKPAAPLTMGGLQEVGLRAPQLSHGHPGCLSPRPQADDRVELARSISAPSATATTRRKSSATERQCADADGANSLGHPDFRADDHGTSSSIPTSSQAFPKLRWSRARTTLDSSGRPRHKA